MTVIVGAPDDGQGIQVETAQAISTIATYPNTKNYDVARWAASYISLTSPAGAGNDVTLTAQWLEISGALVLPNPITIAVLPPNASTIGLLVYHLGATIRLVFSGGNTTINFTVVHTNRPPLGGRTPYTPNMAGTTIMTRSEVLGASTAVVRAGRGSTGFETAAGVGYVGPALLTCRSDGGGPCDVELVGNGLVLVGGVTVPGITALITTASQAVQLPPTQWSLVVRNGATAQTVDASVQAI